MQILVIEDDFVVATYMKYKLEKSKLPSPEVDTADSLLQARRKLAKYRPDIITLDLSLQVNEPDDIVKQEIPSLAQIAPVIVISGALYEDKLKTELMGLGATDFLDKNKMTDSAFIDRIVATYYRVKNTKP